MPDTRRALGAFGEAAAAAQLARQGYDLLERGWRCRLGEIDIVARRGDELVFVEVRAKRGTAQGSPEESITPAKQARLAALAHAYLDAHQIAPESAWRIDVVAVVIDHTGRVARLTHIEHAVGEA